MDISILEVLRDNPEFAVLISLFLNIVIAVAGILPSYFLTAANIVYFGFWDGTIISFIGESIGVLIAFMLYRHGFQSALQKKLDRYEQAKKLIEIRGSRAFTAIFSLRLMPFIPSGVVTFFAAIGVVSVWTFFLASTIGKIPALLLEAISVYHIIEWNGIGKMILACMSIALLVLLWNTTRKKNKSQL
ncbi:TVP38/TMEM64 family protein [Alkalihalobacillus sp. AL-G]|uniref:TVP38/TMEM64 family protein n=1 Tax=Alkalihalobacillus sp. AL-G TaxID=2926399 RepID=UPI00272BA9B5|nr:VTT domain-containing protein [Alkalihalobacillus sp. AL-G]WLD95257.1 VTT domain-containing protein [Alkalihalobacillus sp. AL-G]